VEAGLFFAEADLMSLARCPRVDPDDFVRAQGAEPSALLWRGAAHARPSDQQAADDATIRAKPTPRSEWLRSWPR